MTFQPAENPRAAEATRSTSSQFVGFQLGGQDYAFRIEQIQEIVILDKVTKTPQVPDYVEGVCNLRGAIIPVINLRKLFGLEPKPVDAETRTIVVNVGERTMGCTVDLVSQVIRIAADTIQPAPETVTLHADDRLLGTFDAPSLEPTVHEFEAWLEATRPAHYKRLMAWRKDDREATCARPKGRARRVQIAEALVQIRDPRRYSVVVDESRVPTRTRTRRATRA